MQNSRHCLIETADRDRLADEITRRAGDVLTKALAERPRASLALTGGRLPQTYLPTVFSLPLDWSRVVLTLADDRVVPIEHDDSNAGLVLRCRNMTSAKAAPFVPLVPDGAVISGAQAIEDRLRRDVPLPIDLAILGIGEDGHIASLFPKLAPDLSTDALCICVAAPPPPHRHPRISLTLCALAATQSIILALTGTGKRKALEDALADISSPLGALAHKAGRRLCIIAAP